MNKSEMLDGYDKIVGTHDHHKPTYSRRFIKEVIKPYKKLMSRSFDVMPLSVLDLGAGDGRISDYLELNHYATAYRFDLSKPGLLMGKNTRIRGLATQLSFTQNSFHGVICKDVLVHIEDKQELLGGIFNVLKPGGWALFVSEDNTVSHVKVNAMSGTKHVWKYFGLENEKQYLDFYQFMSQMQLEYLRLVMDPPYYHLNSRDFRDLSSKVGFVNQNITYWTPEWGELDWYNEPNERFVLSVQKPN